MISAIVRCHTMNHMLDKVIRNLNDIDFVLVAVCNFTNDEVRSGVEEILKNANQDNVYCAYFPRMEQRDLFNACVDRLDLLGSDVILINDADEILLKEDRDEIVTAMLNNKNDYDAVHTTVIDYALMDASEMYELRTHHPVVAIKPTAFFEGNRSVGDGKLMEDVILHHFGYAKDLNGLDWKMKNLWYNKESADKIMGSKISKCSAPTELKRIMR